MTDISVIKTIISVAVWRIYPSWVNDKLRAWEGFGHSGMFWARLSRDDFRSKLEIISFLSRLMSVSKSCFCFPRFWKIWRQMFKLWDFRFRRCFGALLKTPLCHRAFFFANSDYDHKYFLNIPFLFSKAEPVLLAWLLWQSQVWAKHFGDGTSKTRMKTRLPGVGEIERRRTIDRRRDWYESCAMIHGPEEKKHKEVSMWLCEGSTFHHLQTSEFWGACFRDPTSLPFLTSLFSWTWMYSCRTVRLQRGDSEEKQSSWHFRCWSLRRNELVSTDLVLWTEALHRFSSRDAIIVVGSVLEKYFDGDFTPDQEKDITFKRWPPGYQSWKLGSALNGLKKN